MKPYIQLYCHLCRVLLSSSRILSECKGGNESSDSSSEGCVGTGFLDLKLDEAKMRKRGFCQTAGAVVDHEESSTQVVCHTSFHLPGGLGARKWSLDGSFPGPSEFIWEFFVSQWCDFSPSASGCVSVLWHFFFTSLGAILLECICTCAFSIFCVGLEVSS